MKRGVGTLPAPSTIYIGVCTALFVLAYITVSHYFPDISLTVSLLIAAFYIMLTFGGAYIIRIIYSGRSLSFKSLKDIQGSFVPVVNQAVSPSAVFNLNGKLEWCNAIFERDIYRFLENGVLSEKDKGTLLDIAKGSSAATFETAFSNGENKFYYSVDVRKNEGQLQHILTVWHNVTSVRELEVKNEEEKAVYCYFFIDNLEESVVGSGARDKIAASETEKIISEWAKAQNGGVTTLDVGKYLVVLKRKHLQANRDSGFDIMKRVKEVKLGNNGYSVTLSGGFASLDAPVSDNMEQAQAALEMALKRGGDQIVLMTGTVENKKTEFFGGTTKSRVGFTRRQARNDAGVLVDLIKSSSNVVIMGHRNMDFDCIGACMGLYRISHHFSMPTHIVLNQAFMDDISRMSHENLVNSLELLGERLEYRHIFIGANDAEEIFTSNTLLIVADVSNLGAMENKNLLEKAAQVAYIDHHQISDDLVPHARLKCINTSASSTCELVASMLEYLTQDTILTENEATLMLTGIILDTNHYRRNTTRNTFQASQYLMSANASSESASGMFVLGYKDYLHELEYEKNIVLLHDSVAFICRKAEPTPRERIIASRVGDKLITHDGILACFIVFYTIGPEGNNVSVSARCRGASTGINVGSIVRVLNDDHSSEGRADGDQKETGKEPVRKKNSVGGDYEKAGGDAPTGKSIEDVERTLKRSIDDYFKKLQQDSEAENK